VTFLQGLRRLTSLVQHELQKKVAVVLVLVVVVINVVVAAA
jgi:hypothetical protein